MNTLLLDASVVLAAFDEQDSHCEAARAVLVQDASLFSLDLARYEVTNAAVRGWAAPAVVPWLLSALERIANDGGILSSTSALLTHAAAIAEEHGISVYDAAYVAAARESGRRLVSCDQRDLVSKGLAVFPADASGD